MIPDANEVLPRLWIGTCASCDAVRGQGIVCLNVLESPHTDDQRCQHLRILDDNLRATASTLDRAAHTILQHWPLVHVLVHCGAGVERSPLTVAWLLCGQFRLTWDESYAWLKRQRPQVEDRQFWLEH
jgi:protein-tyrosine phosphatase